MIVENKSIPSALVNKPKFLKILKNVLKNDDIKSIALTNARNNKLRAEYNKNLKQNFPKILEKYRNIKNFEYDNDLMTLEYNKKHIAKDPKKFKDINEEFKDIVKKMNVKEESPKPDSIRENLKNIFNYRKKMAMRFKYNNIKNNKLNIALLKSKSQILQKKNLNNNINTRNNMVTLKLLKNITSNSMCYRKNNDNLKGILKHKNNTVNQYEEQFMITGMNNKKYKDNVIDEGEEEKGKDNESHSNHEKIS